MHINHSFLNRVKIVSSDSADSFHRCYVKTISGQYRHETSIDGDVLDLFRPPLFHGYQYGTCTATAFRTSQLRSGQAHNIPEERKKRLIGTRLISKLIWNSLAINVQYWFCSVA